MTPHRIADALSRIASQASQRTRGLLFGACLLAVLVLSLIPIEVRVPSTGWDKTNHLSAFATLALLGLWTFPGTVKTVLSGLLMYGALIEYLQALTPHRFAEWLDLLADALGLALGWMLARWLTRYSSHRIARDAVVHHSNR